MRCFHFTNQCWLVKFLGARHNNIVLYGGSKWNLSPKIRCSSLSIYQCIEKLSDMYRYGTQQISQFYYQDHKHSCWCTGNCVDFLVVFPTWKGYSLLAPTLQTMDWKPFRTPSPLPESPPATPPPPPWTELAPALPAAPQVKKNRFFPAVPPSLLRKSFRPRAVDPDPGFGALVTPGDG